jgi:hypothetical protein
LDNVLLAYDGSPRADEALFLATYLADRWGTILTVITVAEKGHVPRGTGYLPGTERIGRRADIEGG